MHRSQYSNIFSRKLWLALVVSISLFSQSVSATTVRVITSLGDFSIELFDDITPITVANFLNYVNSGRYNNTVIHRVINTPTPFIIQGGGMSYNVEENTLDAINTDGAILNEPFISNQRGTVAMAKLSGNPNSATSQWFVNLNDNSANLDAQNGGFTVFGRVIGDGMNVVDAIAALPTFTLHGFTVNSLSDFPLLNFTGGPVELNNFVNIAIVAPPGPNYLDEATGLVHLTVDAGTLGLMSTVFSIAAEEPDIVIQLDLNSIEALTQTVENIATFDEATGSLIIPEFYIGGELAFRNMHLNLTDPELFQFTLESFEAI